MEDTIHILPENDMIMKRWEELHYFEMPDSEVESYRDERISWVPANPRPGWFRSMVVTGKPEKFENLPEPTWSFKLGALESWVYVLTEPMRTVERFREDKGRETRSTAYNNALVAEHNMRLAVNDEERLSEVVNPYLFTARHEWKGRTWEVATLKKTLKKSKLWITETHPVFVAERNV